MWIPYDIRASLKPAGDRSAIARSHADAAPREFLVGFLVRNPVTQAWELDVAAPPMGREIRWARGSITLSGNDAGKLALLPGKLRLKLSKTGRALMGEVALARFEALASALGVTAEVV